MVEILTVSVMVRKSHFFKCSILTVLLLVRENFEEFVNREDKFFVSDQMTSET